MSLPVVILVRPQMGENIGAVARVMANFGLRELRLVAPRDGWPNAHAKAVACGADHVIDGATLFDTLEEALKDVRYVSATTARSRDIVRPCYGPVEGIQRLFDKVQAGENCAILFGPERTGLENEEIAYVDAILTIPTEPEFFSLNLAQSVAITLYQWAIARGNKGPVVPLSPEMATKEEVIAMLDHLEQELEKAGHFKSDPMKPRMIQNLRSPFIRAGLTDQEVRTLRGVITSLVGKKK